MRLSDGIQEYVVRKRTNGFSFERGEAVLSSFSRQIGDVDLSQIKTQQMLAYLDNSPASTITWRLKYYLLCRFFEFWSSRGAMPELIMPQLRPRVRQIFIPYIFSRAELRLLLRATKRIQSSRSRIDSRTLRSLILLLYGTGGQVGEMLRLEREDVNLEVNQITIRDRNLNRSRQIPIGVDLKEVLRKYLTSRARTSFSSNHFFVTKDGHHVTRQMVERDFQRLRRITGVVRKDGLAQQPRLNDIKFTFAVHRITSWIKNGADLSRMLPALAAYMGQVGLGSTERYLYLTPERFRKELNKLSPARAKGRWRNDGVLMEFLATL